MFGTSGAGDLGYSLKKKGATQKQKQENEAEWTRIEHELKQVLEQGIALLSEVSIDGPTLRPPGNSHLLVGKPKRIASFVRLETRLLRSIQFFKSLQKEKLVYSKEIPEVMVAERPREQEAYSLLKELEADLRKFIQEQLARVSANWWTERVPGDVSKGAEEGKARNEQLWPWHTGGELHPIHYVDFPDYVKIIRRRENWREILREVFKDEESVSVKLRELEPIRNSIAHFRSLTKDSLEKLRINAKELRLALGSVTRSATI